MARREDAITYSHENLYAPFYLWRDAAGMNDFLCGTGFLGLVNAFGWPDIGEIWEKPKEVLINDPNYERLTLKKLRMDRLPSLESFNS